jgi:exodeoxyribonuclease V alpha subunit
MTDAIKKRLDALACSSFRARFKLRRQELEYIRDKGLDTIRDHARSFIETRIAQQNPPNDGRQTPMRNHPVFIAQHATATCCRKCIEKWHHIPRGQHLTEEEMGFLVDVIMGWIERNIITHP